MNSCSQNVLLVDDRSENLFALRQILDQPQLHLMTASSGVEALELMLVHDFAVVLLDVQMPHMDGFETATLMRKAERTRHTPIIFVTAVNREDRHIGRGYESGAVDYLFKPIDPDILKCKVQVFCELHHQKTIIQNQFRIIEEKNVALERQLDEIRALRGLLPICANCKSVRDDDGYWRAIEEYFRARTGTQFSHGICPDCVRKLYPELA